MERIAPENQDAFDTTTASLAPAKEEGKPAKTPFPITKAADRDEMRPFRETARWMDEGDSVESMAAVDATRLAKAIVEKYGPRTASIETNGDFKRVIRTAQRPERKPRTKVAKKAAETKQKAAK